MSSPLGDLNKLADPNLTRRGTDTLRFALPTMWHGIASRGEAIRSVNLTIRRLDSIVGLTRLDFRREQISLHDTLDAIARIPMLRSVRARKARMHDTTAGSPFVDSVTTSGGDTSYVYDAPAQAFLEVTHWRAGENLPQAQAKDERFILVTNRRTWPVDRRDYGDSAAGHAAYIRMVDSATGLYDPSLSGFHLHGLGAIDVRRPVVVLKNSTSALADSVRIAKVLDTAWSVTAAFGDTVALDWLEPGWGEMYRVTPIARGLSAYGVAFNNAVRAVNPSLDTLDRPRFVVYERDSIVYLRTLSADHGWSVEQRISAAVDADSATRAYNINPALSTVRNGNSALVVWERRTPGDTAEVRALYLGARPVGDSLPTVTPLVLSTPRAVDSSIALAPAVTGLDSGYIVGWGSRNGVELVAVRDAQTPDNTLDVSTMLRVVAQNVRISQFSPFTTTLDTLSLFPSLAYRSNFQYLPQISAAQYHVANLAWQAGSATRSFILYTGVGANFGAAGKPLIAQHITIEHVSRNLPACLFRHPCVAVDSLRVGVAFEMLPRFNYVDPTQGNTWTVALRFRDSVTESGNNVWKNWNTPAYAWSERSADYIWPSVTQFPATPKTTLSSHPDGGLAWVRDRNDSTDGQRLYRYNERGVRTMNDGDFPTMVLAPFVRESPWTASGLFYRDPDTLRVESPRPFGGTGWRYAGRYENAPGTASPAFAAAPPSAKGIYAYFEASKMIRLSDAPCEIPAIMGGIRLKRPDDNPHVFEKLPPTFFKGVGDGSASIETFADAATVARTGEFVANDDAVMIERRFVGSDSLLAWLDTEPYDSTLMRQADVMFALELVRVGDDSVCWRSDTLTARSVADSVIEDAVEVPLSAAPTGTAVYIRLLARATDSMTYDLGAGFAFYEDSVIAYPRRAAPEEDANGRGADRPDLTLRIVPNPLRRGLGEVHLRVAGAGGVAVWLSDLTGTRVRELPLLEADRAGEYILPVDFVDLPDGAYLLRAQGGAAGRSVVVVR